MSHCEVHSTVAIIIMSPPIGPQCNQIVRKLHGVDWQELANQLNLEDETQAIAGACQQENPVACRLRQIVDKFINSQDLEPCHMTVEKVASALEKLKYTKQAGLIRSVCSSKGGLFPQPILQGITIVYLTSPEPSKNCHNSVKTLTALESSQLRICLTAF